jgi:hypothetical protein
MDTATRLITIPASNEVITLLAMIRIIDDNKVMTMHVIVHTGCFMFHMAIHTV